jgi:hypothetical protein
MEGVKSPEYSLLLRGNRDSNRERYRASLKSYIKWGTGTAKTKFSEGQKKKRAIRIALSFFVFVTKLVCCSATFIIIFSAQLSAFYRIRGATSYFFLP